MRLRFASGPLRLNAAERSQLRSAPCFTNSSAYPQFSRCFDISASFYMFVGFAFASLLLLLPAYVSVVWTGLRRRRLRGPAASAATGRSDVFTYVMTTVDVIGVVGSLCFSVAVYTCSQRMKLLGCYVFSFTFPGQTFFHCLTCVERYLAVVRPVTCRRLSLTLGATLRHASVGGVLLLMSGLWMCLPSNLVLPMLFVRTAGKRRLLQPASG